MSRQRAWSFLAAALLAAGVGCGSAEVDSSPDEEILPEGYSNAVGAKFPDFHRSDGRADDTYREDCGETRGAHAFACAEQRFWQAVQFEPARRLETHALLERHVERLESTPDEVDRHRLALLHWRKVQLGLMLVAEHDERSVLGSAHDDLLRANALAPDHVPIRSWLDTFEVTVAVAGAQAVGEAVPPEAGIDEKLAVTAEHAGEDFTAFYNFIITAAAMPMETGWPQAAAEMVEERADTYSSSYSGFDAAFRAPFVRQGIHLTYGDVLARAGRVDAARAQFAAALQEPGAEAWPYRDHAELLRERTDELVADYASLGHGEGAFFSLRTLGSLGCSSCHVPANQPPVTGPEDAIFP